MSERDRAVFKITSKPGVKRDGTPFDNEFYGGSLWARFQRGRPRKIGGYSAISDLLTGPVRAVHVHSSATVNRAHTFSPFGVEQLTFDNAGIGGGIVDRTPAGLAASVNYAWQVDAMYSQTGSPFTALVCAVTPDLNSIASDSTGGVYAGDIAGSGALTAVSDGAPITVSGGCVVLQPFLFVYGSNGLIRNSNANDFSAGTGWTGGDSNTANVAGTKIVKGLPTRGGASSPAGLFWALDALIRVSYVGGTTLWKYDPVSAKISVLSKAAILEYDNVYFWPGVDRFYFYNGVVQELPNNMNLNWFYDNLNMSQRQKVWATSIPRYGEIWWFFPSGTSTECDQAIIFNVREQTWYDTRIARSAGFSAQVFPKPILAGGELTSTQFLAYTAGAGVFAPGNVITGGTSGAVGEISRVTATGLNLINVTGTFVSAETITAGAVTGTTTAVPVAQSLDVAWQHETGVNRTRRSSVTAIESYFETSNFQWQTGGPTGGAPGGPDKQTRLVRFEPDFIGAGEVELTVRGRAFAQAEVADSAPYMFDMDTEFVSPREQRRHMFLRVSSNVVDGDYQMGAPMIIAEPGDTRS